MGERRAVSAKCRQSVGQNLAPGFKQTVTMKRNEILQKLNLDAIPVTAQKGGSWMKVLSTTKGHRIKEMQIAGETFSGPEVRKLLGLRSSQFSWKTTGDEIQITTYGYGHGVGMSQWGANGMAQEGHTATQILKHYYLRHFIRTGIQDACIEVGEMNTDG